MSDGMKSGNYYVSIIYIITELTISCGETVNERGLGQTYWQPELSTLEYEGDLAIKRASERSSFYPHKWI
jgi:hypothetical protein